jgi:hypothetical protein
MAPRHQTRNPGNSGEKGANQCQAIAPVVFNPQNGGRMMQPCMAYVKMPVNAVPQ